jgi:uncharacterized protein
MTRIVPGTLTCPHCRADVPTQLLASSSYGAITTEFRRVPLGLPAEPYLVHTCPKCGLSGWDTTFDRPVMPAVATLIAERITPRLTGQAPPSYEKYEYAAWLAQWHGEPDEEIAHLYLSAAWCYEFEHPDEPATDRAATYRRLAISHNERALAEAGEELWGNERAELTYLVGELYRRAGDPVEADRWFARVADLVEPDDAGERIAALAERQRHAPADLI